MLRLDGLAVSGFKSFADKTELVIPEGITCVVGPNGCGKSNILDAISWVLGEQSPRTLRGARMEDVIFAGSRNRKPAGMAEVSLHFSPRAQAAAEAAATAEEHHGLDESVLDPRLLRPVVITRRLYRNGDSEYLIDGERARLKDIQSLIMGTGMGTRLYSIIEQGRVGQILSSKPTDRRILIEEAAGITRYKLKRKAAKIKLDESEQSLLRVTDIITELEKQIRSLKRQASTARRYRRLAARRRIVQRAYHAARFGALSDTLRACETEVLGLRQAEQAATAELLRLEEQAATARERVAELEARRDSLTGELHAVDLGLERSRSQVAAARQRLDDLEAQTVRTTAAAETIRRELAAVTDRRDQCRTASERLEAELVESRSLVESRAADTQASRERLAETYRTIALTKEDIFEVMSEAAGLRNRKQEVEAARLRLDAQAARLAVELAEAEEAVARVASELARAQEVLRKAVAAEDQLRQRLETTAARVRELGEQVAAVQAERDASRGELDDARWQLSAIAETVRTRAAYAEGIRKLLESRPAGALGTVADHVTVRPGDELAAEKALGTFLQAVAFSSRQDAEEAARGLAHATAAEAAFVFPDAATPDPGSPAGAPGDARVLGPLSSSLTFAAGADWMRRLVPRAFLVATADEALELARRHPDLTWVSRDGVLIGPGGQGSAGRPRGEGEGILETKSRQESLSARASDLQARVAGLEARLATLEEQRASAATEREELQAALGVAERESLSRRHDVANLRQTSDAAESRRDAVRYQHDVAAEELASAIARIGELDGSLEQATERHAGLDRKLKDCGELASRLETEVEGADAELARLREELAVKGERRAAARAELARVEQEVAVVQGRAEVLAREAESLGAARAESARLRDEAERSIADGTARWEELKAELGRQEEGVRAGRTGLIEGGERLRELRNEHDRVARAAADADVRRERVSSDLEHLVADCREDLGCHPEELPQPVRVTEPAREPEPAAEEPAAEAEEGGDEAEAEDKDEPVSEALPWDGEALDVDRLSAEMDTLRRRLDRIGPVNLVAIDEYDKVSERYGFLSSERDDLVTSIASLRETIAEIDQLSRERFQQAFEEVSKYYNEAFTTLFRGGRGELRLQDEEDPLECGIEIIAQPPGKRLQNMMLLSGGEKALSAIALLFALFRYKPSPFCVLDEVDAPLDETNVVRFIELVSQMAKDTQFVVITHDRRSMERANVLYGVTMEEPGCSKLVSVSFAGLRSGGSAA